MFSNKYQNEYKIAESFHIKEMDGKFPKKQHTKKKGIVKRFFCLCFFMYVLLLFLFHLFRDDDNFGQHFGKLFKVN